MDYKDINTGALQFRRAEFWKRCSKAGASVRKSVTKVRKMSFAKLFPPISRNSSSSFMASSKWARDNSFRIQTRSSSTWRGSTSRSQNYFSTISDDRRLPQHTFTSGSRSTSPRSWTQDQLSSSITTYCLTNMRSHSKQLPKQLQT